MLDYATNLCHPTDRLVSLPKVPRGALIISEPHYVPPTHTHPGSGKTRLPSAASRVQWSSTLRWSAESVADPRRGSKARGRGSERRRRNRCRPASTSSRRCCRCCFCWPRRMERPTQVAAATARWTLNP